MAREAGLHNHPALRNFMKLPDDQQMIDEPIDILFELLAKKLRTVDDLRKLLEDAGTLNAAEYLKEKVGSSVVLRLSRENLQGSPSLDLDRKLNRASDRREKVTRYIQQCEFEDDFSSSPSRDSGMPLSQSSTASRDRIGQTAKDGGTSCFPSDDTNTNHDNKAESQLVEDLAPAENCSQDYILSLPDVTEDYLFQDCSALPYGQ